MTWWPRFEPPGWSQSGDGGQIGAPSLGSGVLPLFLLFLPQPEFINLCFWFVPPSLRGREGSPDYWPRLGKVRAAPGRSPPIP